MFWHSAIWPSRILVWNSGDDFFTRNEKLFLLKRFETKAQKFTLDGNAYNLPNHEGFKPLALDDQALNIRVLLKFIIEHPELKFQISPTIFDYRYQKELAGLFVEKPENCYLPGICERNFNSLYTPKIAIVLPEEGMSESEVHALLDSKFIKLLEKRKAEFIVPCRNEVSDFVLSWAIYHRQMVRVFSEHENAALNYHDLLWYSTHLFARQANPERLVKAAKSWGLFVV